MTHAAPSTSPVQRDLAKIRLGCCANMVATPADPVGVAVIDHIAKIGFEYAELSLRDVVTLAPAARSDLERCLAQAGIGCEACNNFFPADVRLTGPYADLDVARKYAERALAVASSLGAAVVVFGSAGARNVPAGFARDAAWRQLRTLLSELGPIAERMGVIIAIEPLCRAESNIVNTVAEGRQLADDVAHAHVRVLADAYHLREENEDPSILCDVGSRLAHVHVAEGSGRTFPTGNDAVLGGFFRQLRAARYGGRVSIEAYTRDFASDAPRGLRACRELLRDG